MEGDLTLFAAVIAEDVDTLVSELLRHERCLYLVIKLTVLDAHITERLEAEWALVLVLC